MGPVPCMVLRHLWDRSHSSHGTSKYDVEYESQQHIIECLEIRKMKETDNKIIEYEKLFGENVENQLKIAKCFLENMNIKSKLEKRV